MDIFVGNLPRRMSAHELEQLCSAYAAVQTALLVTESETGRSRGFGFISVADSTEADQVVRALDGTDVQGRPIRVSIVSASVASGWLSIFTQKV